MNDEDSYIEFKTQLKNLDKYIYISISGIFFPSPCSDIRWSSAIEYVRYDVKHNCHGFSLTSITQVALKDPHSIVVSEPMSGDKKQISKVRWS